MKCLNVLSSTLPEIDDSIKECVNYGQWLLFKSNVHVGNDAGVTYFLQTEQDIFGLDDRGQVVSKVQVAKNDMSIDELIYFSDLPAPSSLSNLSLRRAA